MWVLVFQLFGVSVLIGCVLFFFFTVNVALCWTLHSYPLLPSFFGSPSPSHPSCDRCFAFFSVIVGVLCHEIVGHRSLAVPPENQTCVLSLSTIVSQSVGHSSKTETSAGPVSFGLTDEGEGGMGGWQESVFFNKASNWCSGAPKFENQCLKLTAQLLISATLNRRRQAPGRFPQSLIQEVYLVPVVVYIYIFCRTWHLQQEMPVRSLYPASFLLFRIPCSHPPGVHNMFIDTSPDSLGMKERVFGSCYFPWRAGHSFTRIQSMHCHFHVNPHPKFLWVSKDLL